MYQALDGHLIEVTTMGELSLEWPKGGRGCLIEVYYYLGTLIIDCFIEGGCSMEVELFNLQQENDKDDCN